MNRQDAAAHPFERSCVVFHTRHAGKPVLDVKNAFVTALEEDQPAALAAIVCAELLVGVKMAESGEGQPPPSDLTTSESNTSSRHGYRLIKRNPAKGHS
jgi:hypothetical protein